MNKIVVLLLLIVVGCKNSSTGLVEVNVTIDKVPAQTIYLRLNDGKSQPLVVDSVRYGGKGAFTLRTKVIEPSLLELTFGNNISLPLISSGEKIGLSGSMDSLQNLVVTGSEDTKSILTLLKENNKDRITIQNLYTEINNLKNQKKQDSAIAATEANAKEVIQKNFANKLNYARTATNPVNAFVALRTLNFPEEEQQVRPLLDSLAKKFTTNSFFKNAYATVIAPPPTIPKNTTAPPAVSNMAKEISLPDVNGKVVTLSSFKGKYVLVDFWASWCGPCRAENPNVVDAYNKFKNKNFTILGVSLDKSKDAWVQAIGDDKLTWTHISDLKFWQSQAAVDYGVQSIPYNILVNPKGEIIASNLRGGDLHTKLQELLP